MKKTISLLTVLAVFMLSFNGLSVHAQTEEEYLLSLVNTQRVNNGLEPLVLDTDLTRAANVRAQEASVCFSHTRPDGTEYYTVSYDKVYGENLAVGNSTNMLDQVILAWMLSPSHKANLLDVNISKTGFGIYRLPNGSFYVAAEFNYKGIS